MQTPLKQEVEEELKKTKKKESRFGNLFFDSLFNIIAYVPAAIISWFISNLDL